MKRLLWLAALCVLALSGCDILRGAFNMPTNEKPVVTVVNNEIFVDPEPLRFTPEQRNVTIIWRLQDSALRFADNGVRIDGEVVAGGRPVAQNEIVDCRVVGDGRQFMCLNKNTRPGKYKYTVRVRLANGSIVEKDPTIFNDR
jgi:hypothetical protein